MGFDEPEVARAHANASEFEVKKRMDEICSTGLARFPL
jgi:hypothetical protein